MITRISSSVLEVPIQYVAEIVHWIECVLQNLQSLFVHIVECVCDFIKDDSGKWYFINLKGFQISMESKARVKIWYSLNYSSKKKNITSGEEKEEKEKEKNPLSSSEAVAYQPLTRYERFMKHEAELGIMCKLCGLFYMEHATIDVVKQSYHQQQQQQSQQVGKDSREPTLEVKGGVPITVVPAYGYSMTNAAGTVVASIYQSYNLPITRFALYLLNNYRSNINFRSVKRSKESLQFDEGIASASRLDSDEGKKNTHLTGTTELFLCCYHCSTIYEKHLSLIQRSDALYQLLGVPKKKKDVFFDAISSGDNPDPAANAAAVVVSSKKKMDTASGRIRPHSAPALRQSQSQSLKMMLMDSTSNDQQPSSAAIEKANNQLLGKFRTFFRELQDKNAWKPVVEDYCTYNALPRTVKHWQILTMIHCIVLEDKEFIQTKANQFSNFPSSSSSASSLQGDYCLIYKIGQMETIIPFSIEKSAFINAVRKEEQDTHHHGSSSSTPFAAKQGKKKQNSSSGGVVHVTPITLNIKESRIHHCLANKEELFQYFKEKNINISLFSYDEDRKNRPPLIKKKSFYEKTFEERKQERLSSLFLTSSSTSATSSPFPSPSRQNTASSSSSSGAADCLSPAAPSSSSDHTMMKECEFDIFLNEMKYFDENSILMNGCAKFDLLIKLKSVNLSSLSIRLSFALHVDSELPLNVNSVKSFFIEKKNIYWPENDYYPTQSPLPATWLSMLLEDYQQKESNDRHDTNSHPTVSFVDELAEKSSENSESEDVKEKLDEIRYYTDHHQAVCEEAKATTEKKGNTIIRPSKIHNKGNHFPQSPHHHNTEHDQKGKNSVAVEVSTRRASFLSSSPSRGAAIDQEELLTPAQRRENKKSFVRNKFSSTFLLNENQFDPKYIEKNTLALRKMSKILNVKTENLTLLGQLQLPSPTEHPHHAIPLPSPFNPSLSTSQSEEISPLVSLNRPHSAHSPVVKETTEDVVTRRIREFSRLFNPFSSSTTNPISSQHHSSIVRIAEHHHNAQIKKKNDEAKALSAIYHNEGFERLLHLIENIFSDEETAFFQHLEKFKNPFSFYPLDKSSQHSSHYPSKIAHLEDDNDEDNEEVWRLLKSKYVIEKVVETLKNIKLEYFHKDSSNNLNNKSNQEEDLLITGKVAVHHHLRNNKQKSSSKSDIEFKRQKQASQPSTFIEEKKKTMNGDPVNGIRESLKSFQKRKITDVFDDTVERIKGENNDEQGEENQDEDEDQDDEEGEADSLDSDMNYISEDILNSMMYTLQYVLVLDFLPVRMKWLTLKSLIIEYSVMFFSSKNNKSSIFNKSRVNINNSRD
jgi:hypothetical protein